ncbi:hypothetical protein KIL84_021502 [Mauremys mutica]|uniref:Uncharacterized protein n=1 Tax=Mauremys mutica TaxID=74926 RepID=A0A9D3X913_9SAUR|nr:hypothetical protein KIL84_021502 [Mauremys mutica]
MNRPLMSSLVLGLAFPVMSQGPAGLEGLDGKDGKPGMRVRKQDGGFVPIFSQFCSELGPSWCEGFTDLLLSLGQGSYQKPKRGELALHPKLLASSEGAQR